MTPATEQSAAPWRASVMSVIGTKAENICSERVFRLLTVQRSKLPFQRVQIPPTEGDPATEGWATQSDPYRGASNLAGCSGSEPVKPRNLPPA